MSLSLRFGFLVIGIILVVVLIVSYLFDRERTQALEANERERIKLHAERAADELVHAIARLRSDARFLARTPQLQTIRQNSRKPQWQSGQRPVSEQASAALEQLFLALAYSRPDYFQVRLIGVDRGGPELVRIERSKTGLIRVEPAALQRKGERYYVKQTKDLQPGQVQLSHIDLNREHGQISEPETATLRATTPVLDDNGRVFALVVINMNMDRVFHRMTQYIPATGQLYLLNQEGDFLYHPDPAKAMRFEHGTAYRLADAFPEQTTAIGRLEPEQGFDFNGGSGYHTNLAYATVRRLDAGPQQQRRITLILTEPLFNTYLEIASARQESYLIIALLVILASALALLLSHRWTNSLRALVEVSHGISRGDYAVEVPETSDIELTKLSGALKHMIDALKSREQRLQRLNQDLEQEVIARSRELAASQDRLSREQILLQSILDHVGDGVIAVDKQGRFLLWNRRAQELLGMGAADLPPAEWSSHFGIYRTPNDEPLPWQQLPLIRALQGETVRDQELYVQNPSNTPGCWVSVFARPLNVEEGRLMGAVAVLVDSEESHRLREQREIQSGELGRIGRLLLIAQIVDTVSHRLSQPFAAIANYVGAAIQLRATGSLSDKQLDNILQQISRQVQRGGEHLDELRELTLRSNLEHTALDVNLLVESALELLNNRLLRLQVVVKKNLTPELPKILGQKIELQQALVHLLVNAMESLAITHHKTRCLRLTTGCSADRKRVQIALGDNGPGIPTALREQVFEAWLSSRSETLGLGLALVRNIVENHNGQVRLEDRTDGLTWFVIEIPSMEVQQHE
jgi:PAS domain S-box-containing protein